MAHRRLLDPLRLSDPLFVFKFSTSVVFTIRLKDKGDSFWKDLSLFFLVRLNILKFYIEMFEVCPQSFLGGLNFDLSMSLHWTTPGRPAVQTAGLVRIQPSVPTSTFPHLSCAWPGQWAGVHFPKMYTKP